MLLSSQTLQGIEITIRGFEGAVKYLLSRGAKFIMAHVFSSDFIEQSYSRHRGAVGGGSNPTVDQYLRNQNAFHLLRNLRLERKRANVEMEKTGGEVDMAPLLKKKKTVRRKLISPS